MKLTIQLITKNNEDTIKETIDSLLPLKSKIIAADVGSQDDTISICQKHGIKVIKSSLNNDYSSVRNKIVENGWILSIEPWEAILSGHALLLEKIKEEPKAYRLNVLSGSIVTKQIKLWHSSLGLKFINPVYETIDYKNAANLPVYLRSFGGRKPEEDMELVKKWKETHPLAVEPTYYEACTFLLQKKWKEFLTAANHYIFMEKKNKMSLTMCHYNCAMVLSYIFNNHQETLKHLLHCVADKPTMAEFWCLLGDVHYAVKQYEKAAVFYNNGLILGARRLKEDSWPFDIEKYTTYPAKMIESCKAIVNSSKLYYGQ